MMIPIRKRTASEAMAVEDGEEGESLLFCYDGDCAIATTTTTTTTIPPSSSKRRRVSDTATTTTTTTTTTDTADTISSASSSSSSSSSSSGFSSSIRISHQAMAATHIQRVLRSKFRHAYSKVYAAAFLSPDVGIDFRRISTMR